MDLKKPEVVFRLQMVDVGGADKGLGGDAQVRWGSYSAFTFTLSQRPKQACGNRRQHEPQLSTLAALGERCAMRACAALRFAQVPPRFYFGRVVAKYQCLEAVGQYTLSTRPYIGPTSMDPQLAFVMCNQAQVRRGAVGRDNLALASC